MEEDNKLPEVKIKGDQNTVNVEENYQDEQFAESDLKVKQLLLGSCVLQAGKKQILVDPNFSDMSANPLKPEDVTKDKFKAIVISRATHEHCNKETLKKIDKSIKIIGNKKVCKICRRLGFSDVVRIDHQQTLTYGTIEIVCLPGSKMGAFSK